jgi:hypothetical protein
MRKSWTMAVQGVLLIVVEDSGVDPNLTTILLQRGCGWDNDKSALARFNFRH